MLNEAEIVELARAAVEKFLSDGEGDCLAGSYGKYIKLTDKYGVKFSCMDNMERNYSRQQRAAKHGLGPECFGYFSITKGSDKWGCYVTQNAEIICTHQEAERFDYKPPEDLNDKTNNLVKLLFDTIGWSFYDSHPANVGYIDGRLVCIDFG